MGPLAKTRAAAAKLLAVTVRSASSNVRLGREGSQSLSLTERPARISFRSSQCASRPGNPKNLYGLDGAAAPGGKTRFSLPIYDA